MNAATIVPQPYLELVANQPYHLALAHLVGKAGFEQYTEFYRAIGNSEDKFLILDNGLIEGEPQPLSVILEKAELVNATEIVLPDVFRDRAATRSLVEASLDTLKATGANEKYRLQAVAQGDSIEEVVCSGIELILMGIDTIAIPKVVTSFGGAHGRLKVLQELQPYITQYCVDVHLLGCWDSPLELKYIEQHISRGECPQVRGVDSAIAYVYARSGLRMSEDERPEGAIDFLEGQADVEILKYNISMWQDECMSLDFRDKDQFRIW